MAKGHDNKGRSKQTASYISLHRYMLRSPAWKSLTANEKCTFIAIKSRYNGFNNGNISMSVRELEEEVGCSNVTVQKCSKTLVQKGFLKVVQKGSFDWKMRYDGTKGSRATTWVLTDEQIDHPEKSLMSPTRDFMKWEETKPNNENYKK